MKTAPPSYYLYFTFPIYFWVQIISEVKALRPVPWPRLMSRQALLVGVAYIGSMESLVLGYFHREVLSLFFIGFACWPFVESHEKRKNMGRGLLPAWMAGNFSLAVFPLLSADMERSPCFLQVEALFTMCTPLADACCRVEAWEWWSCC